MGHGQIALYRMGDSLNHIEEWSNHYASHLEPKGGPLNQRDDAKIQNVKSFEDLRGKQIHFYYIMDHFKNLLGKTYEGNLDLFITSEFPKLRLGLGNDALHPLIHIGYGYSAKSATLICEGFAYLHYAYFPLVLSSYSTEMLGN
jgi:hypothetical protein